MRALLLSLVLAAAAIGCENVVPADDLPYVDHIVINAFLRAGQPIDSIMVRHTLPLSGAYDAEQAALPNATVVLSVEGRVIPVSYTGNGKFIDPNHELVQSGKTYSIDVQWNGLHAYASTRIPQAPLLLSHSLLDIRFDTEYYHTYYGTVDTFITFGGNVNLVIQPEAGMTYTLSKDSIVDPSGRPSGGYFDYGVSYRNFRLAMDVDSTGRIPLIQHLYLDSHQSSYTIVSEVDAADETYYQFLRTYENHDDGEIFGAGRSNPKWNVRGDGIGLFIGTAVTTAKFTYVR